MDPICKQRLPWRDVLWLAMILLAAISETPAYTALDAENRLVAQPPGWKIGYQSGRNNRSITEYVPAAETVDDWTQMLTVQIFRHATVDAATFLQGLGKRYMNDCPETTAKGIFTGTVNGYVVCPAPRPDQ